jgi:hypothetical protein
MLPLLRHRDIEGLRLGCNGQQKPSNDRQSLMPLLDFAAQHNKPIKNPLLCGFLDFLGCA